MFLLKRNVYTDEERRVRVEEAVICWVIGLDILGPRTTWNQLYTAIST